MSSPLSHLQIKINFTFQKPQLLVQALTHKSCLNENRNQSSYERLEFLGDAILELWVSLQLYQLYPDFPEGKLTNLRSLSVCNQNLSTLAQSIGLGDYLLLSQGEDRGGGRQNKSILEDVFEALVGAIYLDSGQDQAFAFLDKFLLPKVKQLAKKKEYKDSKTIYQEIAQAKYNITPHYQVISESGPDHHKTFKVGLYLADKQITIGTGSSKQKAEEDASTKALEK